MGCGYLNLFSDGLTHVRRIYELRMFGHEAFVLDETHKKNDPKAFRCIYLGPSRDHKGSTFYNLHTQRIITSRNYIINEQHKPGLELYPKLYDKYLGPRTSYTTKILYRFCYSNKAAQSTL